MCNYSLKYFAFILLGLAFASGAKAQYSVNMMPDTQIVVNACEHPNGTIYDDGGPTGNHSVRFNGSVLIKCPPGDTITAVLSYDVEYHLIYVYDSLFRTNAPIAACMYRGTRTLTSVTGYMLIVLECPSTSAFTFPGFSCTYSVNDSITYCQNPVSNLAVGALTDTSARLTWSAPASGSLFSVIIDNTTYTTADTFFTVTGLSPGREYSAKVVNSADYPIPCCSDNITFLTPCLDYRNHNFPFDDLRASNVLCEWGAISSTIMNTGCEDYGSSSSSSRHTVHRNGTETDPRTGFNLYTVPDGYCSSVRLGNWNCGQKERITYTIDVDTTIYDLLILKYAAVLENPYHNPYQQPKFTFEITDSNGNIIDECYNAEFTASSELGWNSVAGGALWKDWTTVGVDLGPLHGQRINVRFATYDCTLGAHYGYAYFVLSYGNKNLTSQSCSGIVNTFYAPDGFDYRWYRDDQPDVTLSTADSLHVTEGGFYRCRLDFVGAPEGVTDCHFILTAYAGDRYPVAQFSTEAVDTSSSCSERWLRLRNESFVTSDPGHDSVIATRCESFLWSFDDGTTSTEMSPLHGFTYGHHAVTLRAYLANGACGDSVTQTVFAGERCHDYDTVAEYICDNDSLLFYDTVLRTQGTYSRTFESASGDRAITHTVLLTVGSTAVVEVRDTVVENQLPWNYRGTDHYADFDTAFFVHGQRPLCDSIVGVSLKVWPNLLDSAFYYVCESQMPYTAHGIVFHGDSTAMLLLAGMHGEDSTIIVHLRTIPSSDTAIYDTITDSQLPWLFCDTLFYDSVTDCLFYAFNEAGCDSTIHYNLHIFWNGDHCDTSLFYPNVVTPNNDGINDKFVIGGLIENNCFKYNELTIYSSNGRQLYHVQNIHDDSQWWDPAADRIPAGTYYYYFKAHGIHIWTQHTGVIEVLR